MNHWIVLSLAIGCEVAGTICLKLSKGFEIWGWVALVACFYSLSFWLLAVALRNIELSMAYAIWAGVGTALVAMVGVLAFHESISWIKFLSLLLIVLGVVGLHLSSGTGSSIQ